MTEPKFIPFHKIKDQEVIVVDGIHPNALVLSHWKGGNVHNSIAADTSGGIVLNAIKNNFEGINNPKISATHFDIDGFVGVWALFHKELAMQHFDVLKELAIIGDFRELNLSKEGSQDALKLACYLNAEEKEHFYIPFGEKEEIKLCEEKFIYFLEQFADVLLHTEKYQSIWEKEYNQVISDYKIIHSDNSQITNYSEVGLQCINTKKPVHYYALFSASNGFDSVLSIYDDNKYELEYKYTTWVDIVSRSTLPRVTLKLLCDQLNNIEQSDYQWQVDSVSDTGPILRLEKDGISKAERYANPTDREIYSSSIDPAIFERLIVDFFKYAYRNIAAKKFWTWKEVRSLEF